MVSIHLVQFLQPKQLLEKHSPLVPLTFKVMQFQLQIYSNSARIPTVGTVGNFSSQTSYTAGVAGDLAGTIATDGGIAITAGGAGSTAVGPVRK